tara:strand:- start:3587 stop:4618 length:1032 start_codon:yes stop_codon:yes gene_type:complete
MSYKYLTSLFLFVCFFIFSILTINADIVSINSGGGDEIIINSNSYIGGFFSGDTSLSSEEEESSTTTTTTSTSTGGGGGGGGTVSTTSIKSGDLIVQPPELSLSVIENIEEKRELLIKNIGNSRIVINIEFIGEEIENILTISETQISLNPNEEKILELKINVKGKELLTGKILMKYSRFIKEVPIVIGSKSSNFLFDASVSLSNKFKKIIPGTRLSAQFNLIQVSSDEKVDVVASYIIKDFEGNKYYEESETFFVFGEKNYIKEFPTENIKEGKYVLGFEIVYPGAFAISSTTFDIEESSFRFNNKNLIIILSIIFLIIIVLFWNITKRKKFYLHKKKEDKQ